MSSLRILGVRAALMPLIRTRCSQTRQRSLGAIRFPLPCYIWTFQGAVCARYIQNRSAHSSPTSTAATSSRRNLLSPARMTCNTSRRFGCNDTADDALCVRPRRRARKGRSGGLRPWCAYQFDPHSTVLVVTKTGSSRLRNRANETSDPSKIYPMVEAALASTHANPARSTH